MVVSRLLLGVCCMRCVVNCALCIVCCVLIVVRRVSCVVCCFALCGGCVDVVCLWLFAVFG